MILNPATPIEKVSGDRPFRAGNGGRISTKHEKKDLVRCASDTLIHHLSLVLSHSSSYRGTKPCGNIALLTWYAYLCTLRDHSFDNEGEGVLSYTWQRMMTTMVTIFTLSTTRQLKNISSKREKPRRTNGSSNVRRKLHQCVDLLHQVNERMT